MTSKRARRTASLGNRIGAIQQGMAALEAQNRTPAPDEIPGRVSDVEGRLDLLDSANYREEQHGAVLGERTTWGILDPAYVNRMASGKALVRIRGKGPLQGPFEWATQYVPSHARSVKLTQMGSTYVIMGQDYSAPGGIYGEYPITLQNGWYEYGEVFVDNVWSSPSKAIVLPSGRVQLKGFLRKVGTPVSGDILGSFDPALAPTHQVLGHVNVGDSSRGVTVYPDGTIRVRGGWPADQYMSLESIGWWLPNVPNWIPISPSDSSDPIRWGTGFQTAYIDPHGVPSVWKDPYGFVWFKGLAQTTATISADNTPMIILPPEYQADTEQHLATSGMDVFSPIGARSSSQGVTWKTGAPTASGSWISLERPFVVTAEARDNNNWQNVHFSTNGWSLQYGSFTPLRQLRREDGLAMTRGLTTAGSQGHGVMAFRTIRENVPRKKFLFDGAGANQRIRYDFWGMEDDANRGLMGSVNGGGGLNAWASFDGLCWVP